MTLGEKLMQLRWQKGISQEKLAGMCKIEQTAISRYEHDIVTPNVIIFARIVKALGASMTEIVEDIDLN